MSNKDILILFGTETGNAEDLADQAGNEANKYDLEADIRGMDEVTIAVSYTHLTLPTNREV